MPPDLISLSLYTVWIISLHLHYADLIISLHLHYADLIISLHLHYADFSALSLCLFQVHLPCVVLIYYCTWPIFFALELYRLDLRLD